MLEEGDDLIVSCVVKGDMNIESAWTAEGIIKSLGVISPISTDPLPFCCDSGINGPSVDVRGKLT